MNSAHSNYQTEISERIENYEKGLSQMKEFLLLNEFQSAAACGLKTILQSCNGIVPETNDINILLCSCEGVVDGFPKMTTMHLHEAVTIIEGILIERVAFYKQLENLTH